MSASCRAKPQILLPLEVLLRMLPLWLSACLKIRCTWQGLQVDAHIVVPHTSFSELHTRCIIVCEAASKSAAWEGGVAACTG